MKVNIVYSPDVYKKIMLADSDKKDDIYRYDMMLPFQGKWECYHIPMKPKYPGGYDIIMANNNLIKYYLEKTGVPIEKATIIPATEILNEVKEFWK